MKFEVLELAIALCRIPSTTDDEHAVLDWLARICAALDFDLSVQKLPVGNGRCNLLVTPEGSWPEVLLSTHVDTVPPFFEPTVSEDGKWLNGRGTCDAKGIAAAMLCAFERLI